MVLIFFYGRIKIVEEFCFGEDAVSCMAFSSVPPVALIPMALLSPPP